MRGGTETRPVWIVTLHSPKRRGRKEERDTKYVRAATSAGAVKCARYNSTLPRRAEAFARIATPPQDLGCVPTVQP